MRRGIKTVGGHKEKRGFGRRNKSKPRNKKLVNYYNFKQQGHIEKNCPKLKHTGEGESHSTNMANTDDSDYYTTEDVYYSERNVLSSSCSQLIEAWILDFGFSYHMTPNREWFTTYMSDNFGNVYMGNDKVCVVVGMRQVQIAMLVE